MPTVRLLFFAAARELLDGLSEAEAHIEAGNTVADVRAHLAHAYPALGPIVDTVTLALNLQYVPQAAEGRVEVKDGDEVALIPPISGG
jgi:molybdopterin synthase sulfur carrier subunit